MNKMKRFAAWLLSAAMILGMVPANAFAAPTGKKAETPAVPETAYESTSEIIALDDDVKFELNANTLLAQALLSAADIEVDEADPEIAVVMDELDDMKVQSTVVEADGSVTTKQVGLTDEEKQQVIGLFQMYLYQRQANADVLGAQTPYYLQYNDNKEDGLGTLGEMLTLAGMTVDQVRAGYFTLDDLFGLILNFYYGDYYGASNQADMLGNQLGLASSEGGFLRSRIEGRRDQAMQLVKDSNCQTEAQKYFVLNEFVSAVDVMDMAYIMNKGTAASMKAEEPANYDNVCPDPTVGNIKQAQGEVGSGIGTVKHVSQEQFKAIYDTFYSFYQPMIYGEIAKQFLPMIKADTRKDVYNDVYWPYVQNFAGEEAADKAANEKADQFMELAETAGGIPEMDEAGNPVMNADGTFKLMYTWDELVDQAMDMELEAFNNMTGKQVVAMEADKAVCGLCEGIFGYWEGSLIGALTQSKSVCLGYTGALAFLVQCMHADYYTTDGNYKNPSSWKSTSELYFDNNGKLDINKGYTADHIRVVFDAEVSMFGDVQPNFSSEHFWNAVRIGNDWYYIDCCYSDVYAEVMIRDQVPADGSMNHLYFLISDKSMREMFTGNFSELDTFYEDASKNEQYESSWFCRSSSDSSSDGKYFYYMYDSTNLLGMYRLMADMNNNGGQMNQGSMENWQKMSAMRNANYGIVRHAVDAPDIKDGVDVNGDPTNGADDNFEYLVQLNYKPDSESDETYARVYNPTTKEYVKNDMLTEAFAAWKDMAEIYASAALCADYYDGMIYFTVANAIFTYNLSTGEVKCVKQYDTTVYAEKDKSIKLGGEAFKVTNAQTGYSVYNAPLAGLLIDDETGDVSVSISSNLGYISGKNTMIDSDTYGYEFQESDFQREYSAYAPDEDQYSSMMGEDQGKSVKNDNDEFMFSAIFKDTLKISNLNGNVTFRAPSCNHKFILYRQKYYTKDDYENFGTGAAWVCTTCGKHITAQYTSEETAAEYDSQYSQYGDMMDGMDAMNANYNEDLEKFVKGNTIYSIDDGAWNGNVYTFSKISGQTSAIPDGFDFSQEKDAVANITLDEPVAIAAVPQVVSGTCEDGLTIKYVAEGYTSEGFYFSVDKPNSQETLAAGQHVFDSTHADDATDTDYAAAWTWADNGTPSINMDNLKCMACGKSVNECLGTTVIGKDGDDDEEYSEVILSDAKASVGTVVNGSSAVGKNSCTQSATTYKSVTGEITVTKTTNEYAHEHAWVAGEKVAVTCTEDGYTPQTCSKCGATDKTDVVKATGHTAGDPVVVDPTCGKAGSSTTTCTVCDTVLETETLDPTGEHKYADGKCTVCGAEDPDAKPEDPEVKPEDPEVKPEDPEVKPEDPEVKPEDPEVKPETPEEIPEDKKDSETVEASETTTLGIVIPSQLVTLSDPTGHKWNVEFDWDDDGKNCVAILTCGNANCKEVEKRVVYTEEDKAAATEATCTAAATATYNVSCKVPTGKWDTEGAGVKVLKDTKVVETSQANGHTQYVDFQWDTVKASIKKGETYNPTATLKVKCSTCDATLQTQQVPGFVYAEMPAAEFACQSTVRVYAAQYEEDAKYPALSQSVMVEASEPHTPSAWSREAVEKGYDDVQGCTVCGAELQRVPVGLTVKYVDGDKTTTDVFRAGTASSYKLSNLMYSKTGYHFTGWKGSDGKTYQNQADITANVGSVDSYELGKGKTLTLTATWAANTYTVKYAAGTSGTGTMDAQTMTYDQSKALTSNKFKRTSYHFNGWKAYRASDKKYYGKDKDGKEGWYAADAIASYVYLKNGAEAKNLTAVDKDTVTLTAMWAINTYTVKFKAGTSGTGTMDDMTVSYNKSKALTANKFKRTGYHFNGWRAYRSSDKKYYGKNKAGKTGWYTKANIKSYVYLKNSATVKNLATKNNDTVTLTATWAANTFSISFSGGTGKVTGKMAGLKVTYNKSKALTANKFKRKGYTFRYWSVYNSSSKKYLAKDKAGKKVWAAKSTIKSKGYTYVYLKNKAQVKTLVSTNNAKIKLTAQWKKK